MLALAARVLPGLVAQGDLRCLPLAAGSLDGIWCCASLLHVPHEQTGAVLGEMRRVLRRGGHLALVTALGHGARLEAVPYAPDRQRWFFYREAAQLASSWPPPGCGSWTRPRNPDPVTGSPSWPGPADVSAGHPERPGGGVSEGRGRMGPVASSESPGWEGDERVVRRIRPDPGHPIDTSRWPATVPAVRQLLSEGLELPPGLTVLVGENGSGKSTVMEMLAEACGLNPQGGSAQAELFSTRDQ